MKKSRFTLILSMLLVLGVAAGCSSGTATKGNSAENNSVLESNVAEPDKKTAEGSVAHSYADGTYEGSSDAGKNPGLKVSVVVKDGEISEVIVLEHNETDGIGTTAIEELPKSIVKAQSTEVDSVSGATLSSAAIKDAVDKALEQAK